MADTTKRNRGRLVHRGQDANGNDVWMVRVFVGYKAGKDGKPRRSYRSETVRGSKTKARRRLTDMQKAADDGALPVNEAGTVDAYLDSWLRTVAQRVRPRTLTSYKETLDRYVRPHLGKLRLAKLQPAHVADMLLVLTEGEYSPRTVRKAREVLRNALESAYGAGYIRDNPARGPVVRDALPKDERKERRWLKGDDLVAFLDAAEDDRLHAYWLVLLFGGLRPEEALALRWDDVDLGTATVHVRRVLADKDKPFPTYRPPKSKQSRRDVVLPAVAVDALRAHRKRQLEERMAAGAWADESLVFTTEAGEPLRQWQTHAGFKGIVTAAELDGLRIYDLRHSNASLLLASGEGLKAVADRLGHSTITLTADTYGHTDRETQERGAAKLDELAAGGGHV